jgi:hypothetical protein
MTNELRSVLAGPRLALCVVGLLGVATACSGSIETQETKPSISSSGTGGGPSTGRGSLAPQPGINEGSPNVSGRATGAGSDGEQSTDDIDRAPSSRASGGSSRSRNRDRDRDLRDAGVDEDAGVEADAGIELDGGVEVDAGALDAGAADAAP